MKFTTSIVAALGLVSSAMAAPAEQAPGAETYEVSHVVARTGRSIVITFHAAPVTFSLPVPLGKNAHDAKWVPTRKLHFRVLGEFASLTPASDKDLNINLISFADGGIACNYKVGSRGVVL